MVLRALPSGGIRVTFNDWEKVNLCALFCIIYMYSFHSAIPVGVGELRIRGFDHPPCCPKCVFQSEQWLVMSQEEESSEMGRNIMVFIPVCLLLVKEESVTSAPLRILTLSYLNFAECFQLHPGDSFCCLWIWQRWCWRGDFDSSRRDCFQGKQRQCLTMSILSPTNWVTALFVSPTNIEITWS